MQFSTDTLEAPSRDVADNGHSSRRATISHGAPHAPLSIKDCGVEPEVLENLALKLAYSVPRFTTEWAARRLCLPLPVAADLLETLRTARLVEVLGQAGTFSFHHAITDRGRERSVRLLEISGYVGPAPVSLEDYTASLESQFSRLPEISMAQIAAACSELVLPANVVQVAGLSMVARRSLFLYGPPGNGKTTLGHLLSDSIAGDLWIPHCIGVDHHMIRVYDPACHELAGDGGDSIPGVDRRWVRIRPPFIVVGGELTMEALDLIYSPSLGYYQAPLHFKANGGVFLLDDFGCQRVSPDQLINRWIHPLERQVDFLTLRNGQQLKVPFRQMLIVATNIHPEQVMTPAFMRRMGYRVHLDDPWPDQYSEIFRKYADRCRVPVSEQTIDALLARYRTENRPLRCCEPRDLIERARDYCRSKNQPLELSQETLDVAWEAYFGNR